MDFIEILLILIGLICPWFCWHSVRDTIEAARRIKRCTVEATAEILSWRIQEDSDNPTECTPTIRYSFRDQVYQVEFRQGIITRYQKERDYTGDTMTIFIDPDDAANITPENKFRTFLGLIEGCIFGCGIALFFFFLAVLLLALELKLIF